MADERLPYPKDTLFLVTESEYDQAVMRAAIAKKFKDVPREMIATSFNMSRVQHLPQLQMIVCTRIIISEDGSPGERRERNANSELVWMKVNPSTYIEEVVFSAPIKVGEKVKVTGVSLSSNGQVDLTPLLEAVAASAWPYRILPENPPDVMCRVMGRQ